MGVGEFAEPHKLCAVRAWFLFSYGLLPNHSNPNKNPQRKKDDDSCSKTRALLFFNTEVA
jgi:hypothetical protein